jgi:putative transposase
VAFKSKWTPEQKIAIVMESLNTNIPIAELCRKHNVTPNAFYDWRDKFIQAGKLALSSSGYLKSNNPAKELQDENEKLKNLIGELTIANSALKKALMEGGGRKRR